MKLLYGCSDNLCKTKEIKTLLFNTLSVCLEYRNLAAHGGRVYNYKSNAAIKVENPEAIITLNPIIEELDTSQGLALLLNSISIFSYQEPYDIIDKALRNELNRHLSLYEKDLDILGETLNLTIFREREDCILHNGKEYPVKSVLQSGFNGAWIREIPDELQELFLCERKQK